MTPISSIKEHMEVYGADGILVGVVDHTEGDGRIKLTKTHSVDGQHHFINVSLVDHVDQHVHLSKPADDVMDEWENDEQEVDFEDADDAGMADIEESTEQKQKEWLERRR